MSVALCAKTASATRPPALPTDAARAAWEQWLRTPPRVDFPPRTGRVLLISYEFPPVGGSGVQRPAKLVKYLSAAGWSFDVLTAGHDRFAWHDADLLADLPNDCRIHRVPGYEPACLAHRVTAPFRWLENHRTMPAGSAAWVEDRLYWRMLVLADTLARGRNHELWIPNAAAVALRLHQQRRFDAVISTGPPHFVHRIALRVARQANLPWIADLRDPPVNDISGRQDHDSLQAMRRVERTILRHAALVVTTCPSFTRELVARYPERSPGSIRTITNGFDRHDLLRALSSSPAVHPREAQGTPEPCVFLHAGACYGRIQLAGLIQPLERVLDHHPEWHHQVRLDVAGTLDRRQHDHWTSSCPSWMTLAGYQGHSTVIRAAAQAACAVILLPDCAHARRCIPGKTFELLALPTHLLALAPTGSDTQRLVSAAGGSTVVPFEDQSAVAVALERIIADHFAGRLVHQRDWPALDIYDRRTLAAAYAEGLDFVRANRGAST